MANPRTATEVMVEFLNRFLSEQDQVNDTAVGSETYNLGRAVGRLASEIEAEATLQLQQNRSSLRTGDQLDLEASDSGVPPRKAAQRATGKLVIHAASGTNLAVGMQVRSRATQFVGSQVFILQQPVAIGQSQEGVGNITAQKAGPDGNVDPGLITELVVPNSKVFEIFNPNRTAGGDPVESDESLRERIALNPERKRGGTRAAIRGALLAVPGVTRVETISGRPNRGDSTIVMSDATGGLTQQMLDSARLAVLGDASLNIDGVGTYGVFYFFVPPRRLVFDIVYQAKVTQEANLPAIAAKLRASASLQISRLKPGQRLAPSDLLPGAQAIEGIQSIDSVSMTATHGLQILTGVTIAAFKLPVGRSANLRYVATERSFSFDNGPRRFFTASGQVRLFSSDGTSYVDVLVDISTILASSATETIDSGPVDSTGIAIEADELPLTGNVTVVKS